MSEKIEEAAEILVNSKFVIALTGAGISVESGIPAFRGAQGLWEKYDPSEYAHINSFLKDPAKVWRMLKELYEIIQKAAPNPAHYALSELENMGILKAIITQNVDALHQRAGSRNVIEFHGTGETLVCLKCGKIYKAEDVNLFSIPPRCSCGGILKPNVVFFGEPIPESALRESFELAEKADCVLVVGTSCQVYPAAQIPQIAKSHGAKIIEINLESTPLSYTADVSIFERAGKALPELVEAVRKKM